MIHLLEQDPKIEELHHAFQNGDSVLVEELWDSPKALVAALAQKATGKHILILTGASQDESRLYHDLPTFTERPIVDFPAWETLPNENTPPSPDTVGERYQVLSQIHNSKEPLFILTNLHAALQSLIPPKRFKSLYLNLSVGENIPFELLSDQLVDMGYTRTPIAADKGEFAVRGGIIDIYPVSSPHPFRIEFFGDDIESIRSYDPIGQKSVEQVKSIEVTPGQEMELIKDEKTSCSLLDYLGPDTLIVFDDLLAIEDRYATLVTMLGKAKTTFIDIESFLNRIAKLQSLYLTQQPIDELSDVTVQNRKDGGYYSETAPMQGIGFQMFQRDLSAKRWTHPFIPITPYLLPDKPIDDTITGDEILLSLPKLKALDYSLNILCNTAQEETSLHKQILQLKVALPEKTKISIGYLSSGFLIHESKLMILPTTELTQRHRIRRQKLRSTYHTDPSEVYDLTPGEIVVHLNNGIGKYLGLEKQKNHLGIEGEFFHIEYADKARLYVPINQAHLISKYIGSSEEIPKMHTIGGTRWIKTREKTEAAILGYATDLLEMYAKREIKGGFQYDPDSPDMQAFEEEFPFTETEDQLQAIGNIKKDMISHKAMDRLVCGDVGYGKTEIAMRAAFKAVLDGGRQVAMLVPTTVLAMQHYENFLDRMRNFPVTIGVLSRFKTSKETKKTLEGIANGSVDIVIGTHRLISQDVVFKNLGLVIIDEEQRFGVRAKEHLKKIKVGVDCLTLSATPIPRTLYMSLIGARDMSVINTPPQDRIPIKTVITEPNDDLLKNTLLRELARDGQAYVIHNRVESIFSMADHIRKLLPQARIGVAHGQMHAKEIDLVFHAFKSGQIDILVATSIVENGIDIPTANTILIDRADRFGLADLYQLRGRVGRWNRKAYAYFLIPKFDRLPEITRKRLNALAESSGYGGGMKLAMRDLEIRGAGDMLGTEQSGNVSAVGFHLYCKLLKRKIKTLQGKMPATFTDCKVDVPYDARLPEDYVNETSLRMEIYQKLGDALSWEDVDDIWSELQDRFGPPPEPAEWLYHTTRIRVSASLKGYTLVKVEKVMLTTQQKKGKQITSRQRLLGKGQINDPETLEKTVLPLLEE